MAFEQLRTLPTHKQKMECKKFGQFLWAAMVALLLLATAAHACYEDDSFCLYPDDCCSGYCFIYGPSIGMCVAPP
ncbi:hypothetical protein J1N35_036603 [Gossypium stocksii]|uniref:Uncharacterized protein n=1 Tax=Gossypium stocksii TaxID=47602 RepID=A0A9D3UJ81_9ROSI|nr:hypothetical protein J1N35_036603 [Gossypium stocksii]